MTKVWIVQGEHPSVPGRPLFVCASKEAADREAAALVAIFCREHDVPLPAAPHHWQQALHDVQDRIIKDEGIDLDDPDDAEEIGNETGADVWIDEQELIQ